MAVFNKKQNKSNRKATKVKPASSLRSVLTGGVISSDFFKKYKIEFFLVLVLIMFYISTKYQCQTGMETISKLEERLDVVKAESIRERSRYMSRIRESSMVVLADSIRPGLAVQKQPPFVLSLDNK